jgi:hypothetical protein
MYRRKQYGQSQVERCPFCEKRALAKNDQGFAVCMQHKNAVMNDMLCLCGTVLAVHQGKWGAFFVCSNCGALNKKKVFGNNLVFDTTED